MSITHRFMESSNVKGRLELYWRRKVWWIDNPTEAEEWMHRVHECLEIIEDVMRILKQH